MRVPSYRRHKTGQAFATIRGRNVYFGKHGTPESREKYRQAVASYVATRGAAAEPGRAPVQLQTAADLFLAGPVKAMEYRTRHAFEVALGEVTARFAKIPLPDFGPVRFKEVRRAFVARGWCRRYVNAQAGKVVRWLRWCAGEELYPGDKLTAVEAVEPLRRGDAPDHPRIVPVDDATVDATLPHLPPYARALVEVLRWSGCRPKEAVMMRPEDVDQTGRVVLPGGRALMLDGCWVYTPTTHKTAGLEKGRWIILGPQAVAAVGPLLKYTPAGGYVFSPSRNGRDVAPIHHYRVRSLHKAVEVACKKAGVSHWHPYQLRHLAATKIKALFGEEAAKDVLGHSTLDTTAIYAERSLERAANVMRKAG